jgi:hypothetical protein
MEASARSVNLPKGQQQVVVVQEVGYGVIAGDHHVERTTVMGMGQPHVADRKVDLNSAVARLGLGPGNRLADRSETVTTNPRFARPMARVPIPHETSRIVWEPAPPRSWMMLDSCPDCRSILASQSAKIR